MCLDTGAVTILQPRFEYFRNISKSRVERTGEAPRWECGRLRTNGYTGPYQAAPHERGQAQGGPPASRERTLKTR